jgi:hypothetical protein
MILPGSATPSALTACPNPRKAAACETSHEIRRTPYIQAAFALLG